MEMPETEPAMQLVETAMEADRAMGIQIVPEMQTATETLPEIMEMPGTETAAEMPRETMEILRAATEADRAMGTQTVTEPEEAMEMPGTEPGMEAVETAAEADRAMEVMETAMEADRVMGTQTATETEPGVTAMETVRADRHTGMEMVRTDRHTAASSIPISRRNKRTTIRDLASHLLYLGLYRCCCSVPV